MSVHPKVAIFWDYENCSPPSGSCGLGYDIVNNISRMARLFGSVTTFRAYLDISVQSSKSVTLRSELQSSGLSIIDCPHNGKKDVVDKMILVDMLAFAVDHPTPATIILIAGDRDYAYAVSTLKLRKYQVILIVPSLSNTSPSLQSQASLVVDWSAAALRTRTEAVNPIQALKQPDLDLDVNLVNKLSRELQDLPLDDPGATMHTRSTTSQSDPRPQHVTTRDLLEPSRHYKNAGYFDPTDEFTIAQASPRMSTSTTVLGTLPIPRTPSRSRRVSVATQTHSITTFAQSPSVVARDVSTNNPPPSSVRPSSTPDVIDAGPAKRSPSVLPSLDALELPLHESGPPSSIIVHPPLKSGQPAPESTKEFAPSCHRLNRLAPPFVSTRAPTRPDSISGFWPAGLSVVPTKNSVCESPHTEASEDLKDLEDLIHLRAQDHDTSPGRSTSLAIYSIYDEVDTSKPNYPCCIPPYDTYSPSSGNVGLPFAVTDTPSSNHASPAAIQPRVCDAADLEFTVSPRASNSLGHSTPDFESAFPSNTSPSTPFTTTASHEHDEGGRGPTLWAMFEPLIFLLLAARERGIMRPSRSTIATDLVQLDKQVYQRVGVSRFRDYTTLAEREGIIELGGREGGAWIALHPSWLEMNDAPTPSRTSSPSSEIQSPSSAGPDGLLTQIQRTPTPIFSTPSSASPKSDSSEISTMLSASPTDQWSSASRTAIPAQFRPLIDALVRLRAEGSHHVFRSVVGQLLYRDVYAQAGVSGFKEYVHQAADAQLIELGGVGGHAWIRLHPELRI